MVMLWLAALAFAQEEPSGEAAEPDVGAEQQPTEGSEPVQAEPDLENIVWPALPDLEGQELTPEQLEMLEALIEGVLEQSFEDVLLGGLGEELPADADIAEPPVVPEPPEPDDGFHEPLIPDEEWLLHDLPDDWHEPLMEDPLARRVPLWFGVEVGTLIGARVELSREDWLVETALRVGAYTRVEDGAALQPTAIGAVEVGRGFQLVAGAGVTLRDDEWTPVANIAIQRDRRDTPSHLQSGVLIDRDGWRGLDVTLCWLW